MHIQRFNALTLPQQEYYVANMGVYLSSRYETAFSVHLYEVAGFYVELYFENRETVCSLVRAFSTTKYLDPYLASIDVQALL